MSHFVNKCSCGVVISSCRCFSPSKIETVVENGCEKCKGKTAKVQEIKNVFTLNVPDAVLEAAKKKKKIKQDAEEIPEQLAVEIKRKHKNKPGT